MPNLIVLAKTTHSEIILTVRANWYPDYITKASCQAWLKLLIANEVRIGGLGGRPAETCNFEAIHHLILVATVVVFQAHVPGGNWVTVGFDSPLVRPPMDVHWGRGSKHQKGNGRTRKDWSGAKQRGVQNTV